MRMNCPMVEHGAMRLYEDGALMKRYVCKSCNVRFDYETSTGKVIRVGTALSVFTMFTVAIAHALGGGDSGGGGDSA